MIKFIRKNVFANSNKNPMASYVFISLCVYVVITSVYTIESYDPHSALLRLLSGLVIMTVYVVVERSSLSARVTSFLSPSIIAAVLLASPFLFSGDSLLFLYLSCTAIISFTYYNSKSLGMYIITIGVVIAIMLFVFRINLLGEAYTMGYNIKFFAASMALNSLIYFFCVRMINLKNQLESALGEAKEASVAKSTFLSSMSHEIRTPMNAIIGMTSIGLASDDSKQKDSCFKKIDGASNHLLGVINDILDISKIESGKFELSPEEFNFEKMLQRVANVVLFRIEDKKQKFTVYLDRLIPKNLIGDDQRLAQVVTNLVGNAVKFTPEEGSIRIGTYFLEEENDVCSIQISVTDTGIGISPEQQAKLFTSFQQAEADTSRKFGGTGLGLAISKNIVEMMDGKIWIESETGKGSTFAFIVKMKRGTSEEPEAAPLENVRILVVDNDPAVLAHYRIMSERMGMSCDTAEKYEDAIALINQNEIYDFCITEYHLQGSDGLELTRNLRKKGGSTVVVLVISPSELSAVEHEVKEVGIYQFIQKPLFQSAFSEIIYTSLGVYQEQKEGPELDGMFDGYRILLAEDIEINREIVLALLEPTNIEIDCAENGSEAVRIFKEFPDEYDLILMDVQMPEMDGHEATREIRVMENEKARAVPIIAMTANVFREDIENCLAAGMNDHVGKPLALDDVIGTLEKYLLLANK